MQTFIFGLLLASVSGVTVVAFRHPHGFARLFPYLLAVITVIFVGFNVWHVAIELAWSELLDYIVEGAIGESMASKNKLRYSYMWIVFWYIGAVAFLWVILKLPPFLQIADKEGAPTDEKDSN